jgi:TetR/AcrR family transcriptional regulator, regulator of cefoperazone and chloramphenicol sensitivity
MISHANDTRSNETCRRLLAAASEEFARRGFSNARIRSIVDAARVNLAAVNYYFGGKAGLYRATLAYLAAEMPRAGLPRAVRGRKPEERLERRVFAILERFIGASRPSPLGRILAYEAMDPTGSLESLLEDTMRPELKRLHAILREIAGREVDDAKLTHAALGILGQCVLYLYAGPAIERISPSLGHGDDTCRFLAAQITDFSLGGVERLKRASVGQK